MPDRRYTLSDLVSMPPAVWPGLSDEEKIQRLMGGRPLLPVEYAPTPPLPAPELPYMLGGRPKRIGRNPRTGQPYYEEPTPGILEAPQEIAGGLSTLANSRLSGGERAGGASQALRGGMTLGSLMVPGLLARAPIGTLAGLMAGGVAQGVTEDALQRQGVHPGYASLAGDVAGFAAGLPAGLVPEASYRGLPARIPELIRSETGEIVIRPGRGWGSTLKDLIEQKMPERASADQVRSIVSGAPAEELQYSTLSQLLNSKPTVTKSEVLGHLEQNQLPLTEVFRTEGDTKYGKWKTPHGENYEEFLLTHDHGQYRSSHWDEPGVLGHTRFQEHYDMQGEPLFLTDEFQSDWHQEGRRKGYGEHVPDAPFKKDWQELLVKRMLTEAVNRGHTRIAWPKGKNVAERFDLSKSVDEITYDPESGRLRASRDGHTLVDTDAEPAELDGYIGRELAEKLRGRIERWEAPTPESEGWSVNYDDEGGYYYLDDPSGQPVPRRFRRQFTRYSSALEYAREAIRNDPEYGYLLPRIAGGDLSIGGEGMKGFYDKIVVDYVNKLAKRYGGRVGEVQLRGGEGSPGDTAHVLNMPPAMIDAIKRGLPLFGSAMPGVAAATGKSLKKSK